MQVSNSILYHCVKLSSLFIFGLFSLSIYGEEPTDRTEKVNGISRAEGSSAYRNPESSYTFKNDALIIKSSLEKDIILVEIQGYASVCTPKGCSDGPIAVSFPVNHPTFADICIKKAMLYSSDPQSYQFTLESKDINGILRHVRKPLGIQGEKIMKIFNKRETKLQLASEDPAASEQADSSDAPSQEEEIEMKKYEIQMGDQVSCSILYGKKP